MDHGTDNTLVGVNNMQGNPPGPAIRDVMKRKMEMIKSMREFQPMGRIQKKKFKGRSSRRPFCILMVCYSYGTVLMP